MQSIKNILIISFSNLKTDPRVNRQIQFLSETYHVTTLGHADSGIDSVIHFDVIHHTKRVRDKFISAIRLLLGFYEEYYASLAEVQQCIPILESHHYDLIIANDIDALPLALKYKKNAKVILDAHEYAPREFEDKFLWRLFFQKYKQYLCTCYIPLVDTMLTVCQGIAEEYHKNYHINPIVMTNAPHYENGLKPSPTNNDKIKIIHHGGAIDSRKIELMIETMKYADERFELYLMLVPSQPKYFDNLKALAADMKNVFFLDPVPMQEIAQCINSYDIGFYLLEPNSFNNKHALPNKFFEFIQGRLCIVIGPSIEMASIVNHYELGQVASSFDPKEMSEVLNNLEQSIIDNYKANTDRYAYELSSNKNKQILLDCIKTTLGH